MAGQDDVHVQLGQEGQDVARVPDGVALSSSAGDGHQVVVEHEDLEVGVHVELLADPAVALPPDLALGQVGLRRVDGHDLDPEWLTLEARHRERQRAVALVGHVPGPERVAEVQVPHVLGVVVAGHDEDVEPPLEQGLQVLLGGAELVGVALGGEVPAHHDQVGVEGQRLVDRGREKVAVEERGAAVEVGQLDDHKLLAGHAPSVRGSAACRRYRGACRLAWRFWARAPGER